MNILALPTTIDIGPLSITFYALCILSGALLALFLSMWGIKRKGYNPKDLENLTPEELKEFVMTELRKCYSEAEIQSILDRKSPVFYRFVDETELRALKNGHAISSSAEYNLDYSRTDITSDPNYNFNKYRITFKKDNPDWNPYAEDGSLVSLHDPRSKKWW